MRFGEISADFVNDFFERMIGGLGPKDRAIGKSSFTKFRKPEFALFFSQRKEKLYCQFDRLLMRLYLLRPCMTNREER